MNAQQQHLHSLLIYMKSNLPVRISLDVKRTGSYVMMWVNKVAGSKHSDAITVKCTYNAKSDSYQFIVKHNTKGIIFSKKGTGADMAYVELNNALTKYNIKIERGTEVNYNHVMCYLRFVDFYLMSKDSCGFKLKTNCDGEVIALDKYSSTIHSYKYKNSATATDFFTTMAVAKSTGGTLFLTSLEELREYIDTGSTGVSEIKLYPQDGALHAVVDPQYDKIKAKWFVIIENRLQDITEAVYREVQNYNNTVQQVTSKIPYKLNNGFIEYAFGCGLTHYLQQANMGEVIKKYPAQRLKVWTTTDLAIAKSETNYIGALVKRLSNR